MKTHLVWFRQDLRVIDHDALYHACIDPSARVIAIFIATPAQWRLHDVSVRQISLMNVYFFALQQALSHLNIPLIYQSIADFSDIDTVLWEHCIKLQVTDLFYHKSFGWNEQQCEKRIESRIGHWVTCHSYYDNLLFKPGEIVNQQGNLYQVFSYFKQALIKKLIHSPVESLPAPAPRIERVIVEKDNPDAVLFCETEQSSDVSDDKKSIDDVLRQLSVFCHDTIVGYRKYRDFPAQHATSGLSPYLTLGVISVRQCFSVLFQQYQYQLYTELSDQEAWLTELIWREFYRHLFFYTPRLSKNRAYLRWTESINWENNEQYWLAWQQGKTGYPLVDAAMRQLLQTGWMHNRLRMIVASFLTKDLLIDWRWGEQFFMSHLIDGDLPSNNGGWQWSASTGVDAVPYFRLFNPTLQSQRFDPKGEFIRRYLPELSSVPDKYIHAPAAWQRRCGQEITYPLPIVDHREQKDKAIMLFRQAKPIYIN